MRQITLSSSNLLFSSSIIALILLLLALMLVIYIYQRKVIHKKCIIQINEEQIRRLFLKVSENESKIGRNEHYIQELISEIEQNREIQKQMEELQNALLDIQNRKYTSLKKNGKLQERVSHPSSQQDHEAILKTMAEENIRLRDREKYLCNLLLQKTEILNKLRTELSFTQFNGQCLVRTISNEVPSTISFVILLALGMAYLFVIKSNTILLNSIGLSMFAQCPAFLIT